MSMRPADSRPFRPIEASDSFESCHATIDPSKSIPAEHPSAPPTPRSQGESPRHSKDGVSPKTVVLDHKPPEPIQLKEVRRAKSVSLSIPVLPNQGFDHKRVASQSTLLTGNVAAPSTSASKANTALKISIPPSTDVGFLTALASQERQVLELKEHLSKAEDELSRLKRLWVSQEQRKRQTEARGLHRMTATPTSSTSSRFSLGSVGTGPPTVESMYEEMARRKASLSEINFTSNVGERPPRRRLFSGSRQLRSLSLVTPPILENIEDSESRVNPVVDQLEPLIGSPTQLPPTPDLIEEEDDTDPSNSSTRSSQSPQRERMLRSSMRTSMQMAVEFREGLWTFFEDLKQATVGEDARGSDLPGPRLVEKDIMESPTLARKQEKENSKDISLAPENDRPKKQTIRRQTWQFRPSDGSKERLAVDSTTFWKENGIAEVEEDAEPILSLGKQISHSTAGTLSKANRRDRDQNGESLRPRDPPSRGVSPVPPRSSNATPVPSNERRRTSNIPSKSRNGSYAETDSRKGSASGAARTSETPPRSSEPTKEHFRRDSMAWPILDKFRPGQIRQGVNSLLDDWERSLTAPAEQQSQDQRSQTTFLPASAMPRPITQRTNSRLDEVYQ